MAKKLPKAEFMGELELAGMKIPCFVLDDERRVISGRGMTQAIGMKGRGQGVRRISTHSTLKPFISNELSVAIENPILFTGYSPKTDEPTQGYEATILQEVCEAILNARDNGALKTEQEIRYAKFAYILIRNFARIGIIALIDEATGFQYFRARNSLESIINKYIRDDLRKWTKTFPDEFYERLFRLNGWIYDPASVKRPSVVGKMTNNIIYERLAPGVLSKLKEINPRSSQGKLKHRHHQFLTDDHGIPALNEHFAAVLALMRACTNYDQFKRLINRALPKQAQTIEMLLQTKNGEPV